MESVTFRHAKVRATFQDFVVVDLHTDEDDAEVSRQNKELQERLVHSTHLPSYVVLDPRTENVVRKWGYRLEFTSDPSTFIRELRQGLRSLAALQRGN